jgi:hypothetical protein
MKPKNNPSELCFFESLFLFLVSDKTIYKQEQSESKKTILKTSAVFLNNKKKKSLKKLFSPFLKKFNLGEEGIIFTNESNTID